MKPRTAQFWVDLPLDHRPLGIVSELVISKKWKPGIDFPDQMRYINYTDTLFVGTSATGEGRYINIGNHRTILEGSLGTSRFRPSETLIFLLGFWVFA